KKASQVRTPQGAVSTYGSIECSRYGMDPSGHPLPSLENEIDEDIRLLRGECPRRTVQFPGELYVLVQECATIVIHLQPLAVLMVTVIGLYSFVGRHFDLVADQVAALSNHRFIARQC